MVVDSLAQDIGIIVASLALVAYGFYIQHVARNIAAKIALSTYRDAIMDLAQKYQNEAKDPALSSSEQERRWSMACGARHALQAVLDLEQQRHRG